jgi:pyruvate dehydrogenase E1 component alpha subunit
MDPNACMAEMFGKSTGCAKGKGGSMHMFDKPNWLLRRPRHRRRADALRARAWPSPPSTSGSPGQVRSEPRRARTAKKKVSLAFLGDGALNQGALHEAMNLAGLYSIPVIYVVENNGYSMGTAIERGTTMAHDLMAKARRLRHRGRDHRRL